MEQLISEFLDYLQYERNRSKYTVENYGADLYAFQAFVRGCDEDVSWQTVDVDLIRNWMESMMDKGNSATSINRRLSSLRSFYRFALQRGKVDRDPAYHIKGPKKARVLPYYLREEEMDRLLDNGFPGNSFPEIRNRTIILTFYSTGIRLSELVGLDIHSIDFGAAQLKVLGKRNKERIIPFGKELSDALRIYIEARKEVADATTDALFVNNKGLRMQAEHVRKEVKRELTKVTTMKKRSPHVLRHTFATAMLNEGSDLESIKELLGHESVSTTEIYTHTTFEQLKAVYVKAHPRGDAEESPEYTTDKV